MLAQANNTCRHLWADESGVVLAFTVVVFLTLFVLACSVYAVGENIRQRIELQNAVDAAAYSGAVIEADGLSRIAALNTALGWTYIQLVRMDMDYIVDKWLGLIEDAWEYDRAVVDAGNSGSCGLCGKKARNHYHWVGQSAGNHGTITLNGHSKGIGEVKSDHKDIANSLLDKIINARGAINGINGAIDDIVASLPDHMAKVVKQELALNLSDTVNDITSVDGSGDLRYACRVATTNCFGVPDERGFLRMIYHGSKDPGSVSVFGTGSDSWFPLSSGEGGGFKRQYGFDGTSLRAYWNWHWERWIGVTTETGHYDTFGGRGSGYNEILGDDSRIYRQECYETPSCRPRTLTGEYFQQGGTIVVAASRLAANPFQFMFPLELPSGLFGAFTPAGNSSGYFGRTRLWAVATARAGYQDRVRPCGVEGKGAYNSTPDSYLIWTDETHRRTFWRQTGWQGGEAKSSPYNLSDTDWDATLIPIARGWSERVPAWEYRSTAVDNWEEPPTAGAWGAESGEPIMQWLVQAADWHRLSSDSDAKRFTDVAWLAAPPGMLGADLAAAGIRWLH